jgi:hypothetical protein
MTQICEKILELGHGPRLNTQRGAGMLATLSHYTYGYWLVEIGLTNSAIWERTVSKTLSSHLHKEFIGIGKAGKRTIYQLDTTTSSSPLTIESINNSVHRAIALHTKSEQHIVKAYPHGQPNVSSDRATRRSIDAIKAFRK